MTELEQKVIEAVKTLQQYCKSKSCFDCILYYTVNGYSFCKLEPCPSSWTFYNK